MKEENIEKADLNNSAIIFKDEILLNENRIDLLKDLAKKNNLEQKKELRPMAWKLFLGIIPEENNKSIEEWIDVIDSQRNEYKNKLEKYCSIKKMKHSDPLINNENKEDDDLLNEDQDNNDKNIINLINLDLTRTHQAIELFQKTKTKNILSNILFVYAKENEDLPYGQGMNELISMLFICLYPYYFSSKDKEKIGKNDIKVYLNDIDNHYEDIYLFFHNEEELQSDLFFLFEAIMLKGIKDLYGKDDVKKDDINYKLYELFPDIIKDTSNEERPTHLNLRSYILIKEKLKIIDKRLYNHFKKININCNYFLHRWFKCIFTREFDINEVSCLWDKIFLYEFNNSKKYKYHLIYIDFICLAMIMRIRYQLIKKDEGDCFTILFHYPKGDDISDIIEIAEKICEIFENKINQKDFNVEEILDLIKNDNNLIDEENDNGDANEELIITPHMYNQSNNNSLFSCDKKKENIIFCGKYYMKKKYALLFCIILILLLLFMWAYNNIQLDNK